MPQGASLVYVTCAECGAEVDRIEYDQADTAPAVATVAGALGISEEEAKKLVAKNNPGAERTNAENARDLAQRVAARDVDDRPADSYGCPNGHDSGLTVTDEPPPPLAVNTILRTPA